MIKLKEKFRKTSKKINSIKIIPKTWSIIFQLLLWSYLWTWTIFLHAHCIIIFDRHSANFRAFRRHHHRQCHHKTLQFSSATRLHHDHRGGPRDFHLLLFRTGHELQSSSSGGSSSGLGFCYTDYSRESNVTGWCETLWYPAGLRLSHTDHDASLRSRHQHHLRVAVFRRMRLCPISKPRKSDSWKAYSCFFPDSNMMKIETYLIDSLVTLLFLEIQLRFYAYSSVCFVHHADEILSLLNLK